MMAQFGAKASSDEPLPEVGDGIPSTDKEDKTHAAPAETGEVPEPSDQGSSAGSDAAGSAAEGSDPNEVQTATAEELAAVHQLRRAMVACGHRQVAVYGLVNGRCGCGHADCGKVAKHPRGKGWQEGARENPPRCITEGPRPGQLNTGLLCDGLRVIDIDVEDRLLVNQLLGVVAAMLGLSPDKPMPMRFRSNSARCALLFRASSGEPHKKQIACVHGGVEVLGHGNQCVVQRTHASGVPLQWKGGSPWETRLEELPEISEEQVTALLGTFAPLLGGLKRPARDAGGGPRHHGGVGGDGFSFATLDLNTMSEAKAEKLRARLEGNLRSKVKAVADAEDAKHGGEGRNNALNDAAFSIAQLTAHYSGWSTEARVRELLHAACVTNRYIDNKGEYAFEATFRSGWTAGLADPQPLLNRIKPGSAGDGGARMDNGKDGDMGGDESAKAGGASGKAGGGEEKPGGATTNGSSEDWPPLDLSLLEEDEIPTPHLRDTGLPPSITSLARDIAGATLSPDYTLATIMTSAAGLIGFSRVAHIPHSTWHRHASIYTCLVGVPSSTKTASGRDIINIVAKLDAEALKANEPLVARWKADDEADKAAHDAWRDSLRQYEKKRRDGAPSGPPPDQPGRTLSETPPSPPRLMVSNVTMQRLVALLRDNPMGLILVRDEIEAFFGDMGRYGGSGADRGDYLTLWVGIKLTFDRVKEGGLAITVPQPALSLLGGAQPDKLRDGLLNETDDGMFSRFDFIWPVPPPVGSLFDAREAAAGLASLETVFRRLMAMRMEPEPVPLPLTREGAVFFDDLQQELTKQARVEDGLMAGWLGKGPLKVLSYALVIEHLVHGIVGVPLPTAVSLNAIEAAASYLRNYLQPMALKTIWLTGSDQKRGLAIMVAAAIQRGATPFEGETFSERELYQTAGFRQLRDEDTRNAVMNSLVRGGFIRRLKTGTRAVAWHINPRARPA
jgi:hypothetical protein